MKIGDVAFDNKYLPYFKKPKLLKNDFEGMIFHPCITYEYVKKATEFLYCLFKYLLIYP